jgi:transporter family protein
MIGTTMANTWLIWALLSALFAALTAIFAKLSLQRINPDLAQFVRTAIVLLLMTLVVVAGGKWNEMADWSRRTWILLALSGIATAASWLCYFRALDIGDVTRVAAVDKLSLAIVAVVAATFLSERLGALGWCGVVLVSVGLVLIGQKN